MTNLNIINEDNWREKMHAAVLYNLQLIVSRYISDTKTVLVENTEKILKRPKTLWNQ